MADRGALASGDARHGERSAPTPTVDVVVATHQGWELTERCLRDLERQTLEHHVIVSDGASTDGTPDNVRRLFPHVTLLTHDSDPGYAVAANRGVAAGRAELVLLLNNDAFCRPDFLEHLVAAFRSDEHIGTVAPLTLQSDEQTIDSVGLALDVTLAPFIRLEGQPASEAEATMPLLASPGGGADAYRRSAWEAAGGFDERALGWTAAAAPAAVAVHLRSATSGHRSRRARQSGGWARGYLLRRWKVLRSRAVVRALATELLVVAADLALSRDTVAVRSRISGWNAAGALPRQPVPSGVVEREIGFLESLRLRWGSR
jgi:N-acetylglucosaminyl-diphospho-decaprenol L-rhamnosyltransferase